MIVEVKLFAGAAEAAAADSIRVDLSAQGESLTIAQLRAAIVDQYPALTHVVATSLIAVDETYAGEQTIVSADVELAIIPPVSGG